MPRASNTEGETAVLGLWIEQSAGAKFWLKLRNELKTRGVTAILIAVVDGLKGCPEASGAVFPSITVQACILPLIGNPLASVSGTDRKLLMPDLTAIDRAETTGTALAQPDAFGTGHPLSRGRARPWRRAREHVVPRFAFPPAIRTMIYTTNAVESLNRSRRNIIKTREDARQLPE